MSASLITQGTNLLDIRYRNRMLVFSVEDEEKQQDLLEQELPISHEQVNISEVSHLSNSVLESNNSVNNSLALAIQNLESKLSSDLKAAKSLLQKEKSALYSLQEKNFESGKNGYFLIQAQVKDFNKRRESEQRKRVEDNKKKVVTKILPLLDAFRNVSMLHGGETEREIKMHSDFNVLVRSITVALQKYGYSEFSPEIGELYDKDRHEAVNIETASINGTSTIYAVLRPGTLDTKSNVVRKAKVEVIVPQ